MTSAAAIPDLPVPPYNPFDDDFLDKIVGVASTLKVRVESVRTISANASQADKKNELVTVLREYLKEVSQEPELVIRTVDGATRPQMSLDERRQLALTISETLKAQPSTDGVSFRQVSDACVAATLNGIAEITVGAMIGGPIGALGGFVMGTVGVMIAC